MGHALGLDRPLLEQWREFLTGVFSLDLGNSLYYRRPVVELLNARYTATAQLALAALFIALLIAIPMGIVAAQRRGSAWDRGAMGFSLLGVSIPNFWLGPLLVLVFSLGLGWFPVSGRSGAASVVLPAITLGTSMAAVLSRMLRSSLLEVMGDDPANFCTACFDGAYPVTLEGKGPHPIQLQLFGSETKVKEEEKLLKPS